MLSFDDSGWPLVVVRAQGKIEFEDSHSLERSVDALLDRHQPYAIIWDLADAEIPARAIVMDMLRWTKRTRLRAREEFELAAEPIPSYTAYVLSPRVARLLNFFIQMSPASDAPTGTYASFEDAVEACEAKLASFGVAAGRSSTG